MNKEILERATTAARSESQYAIRKTPANNAINPAPYTQKVVMRRAAQSVSDLANRSIRRSGVNGSD
jgi:hypothetical protein